MEIIKYEVIDNTVSCGFKENNYVVYAQTGVKEGYTKTKYLQEMYQEVKHALDYERNMFNSGKPNSIITEESGEEWVPEQPKVSKIYITIGNPYLAFAEGDLVKETSLQIVSKDQYGETITCDVELTSSFGDIENGVITIPKIEEQTDIIITAA